MIEGLFGLFLLAVMIVLYFAPWLASRYNEHPQQEAIFVLNFFLGWTFIGWVVALVWACMTQKVKK